MTWIRRILGLESEPPGAQASAAPEKCSNLEWTQRQILRNVDPTLRLSDWRASDPMVAEMRRFLDSKFGRDVISCLVNECRVQRGIPNPTAEVIGIELGRIAGHQEAIDILLLMAERIETPPEIPVTYPQHPAFKTED